jgi:formyltetrahydrofolate-dependent phosphoribosylglycinamide formyltransferase
MLNLAVFASGGGTNLQSLLDNLNRAGSAWGRVALVVSDRPQAGALERARAANVAGAVVEVAGRPEEDVAIEMVALLDAHAIDVIALAGYLRLVPAQVTTRFRGRMVNIHPALLPAFGGKGMYGMRVHRAVLESGCRVTGVTVHYVDERYDEGRPLAQWPVPVLEGDTPETLAARVLTIEHRLYPLALELLAARIAGKTPNSLLPATDGPSFLWTDASPDDAAVRRALGLD